MARAPIGVELVKRGLVSESDINQAITYQKEHPNKKIGDILNILNLCPQRELIKALGEILGEKVIILRPDNVNVDMSQYFSMDIAKACKAVLYDVVGGKAKVCFSDTSNKRAIEQIRLILLNRGLVLDKYLTFETNIDNVLESLEGKSGDNIQTTAGDITGIVDTIIKTAMDKRASDVHIEPLENSIRVRYRIDGELVTVANLEKSRQSQIIGRLKAISNMHQEKQESQDGRILLYPNYNIRVSSQKNVNGEKFCLRLLKKNEGIKNIFDLGFPKDEKLLKASFDKRNSITVVAAPTGEGKTTTLYSILDYLNKPEINITTVEDPVEIRVQGINQIEIDMKTTFASSLRTILRQDPDIILVGEIRDLETAEIAMQSGQTGHYVLSTIHTIDAVEVITRLRKMGISDYDISSTLATAVSQRLIRRPCPHCATKREFSDEEKRIMQKLVDKFGIKLDFKDKYTYDINGCKECNHTGYLGRIAAFEILEITEELKELISAGASSIKIREQALQGGVYKPLYVDALYKVLDGLITLEEANKKLVLFQ
jgi:type IV pilus assembly protein PilB